MHSQVIGIEVLLQNAQGNDAETKQAKNINFTCSSLVDE